MKYSFVAPLIKCWFGAISIYIFCQTYINPHWTNNDHTRKMRKIQFRSSFNKVLIWCHIYQQIYVSRIFFFYFKKLWNIRNDVLNTETITENSLISLSQDDIASPKICFFKLLSWGGDERVFKMCKTRFGEGLKMFIFIWRDLILNLKKKKKKSDISSSFHVFLANIHLTFSSPLFSDSPHFSFRNSSTSTQDVCLLMVF